MNGKASLRMSLKCVHDSCDLAGEEGIVRVKQADYISRTVAIGRVEVSRHATMRITKQPYAQAAADIRLNHLAGTVLRGIIADDDFRRGVSLGKRAVDGLAHVGPIVEAGNQHGNEGFPG